MEITRLMKRPSLEGHIKLNRKYNQFDRLIKELEKRELPNNIVNEINANIDGLNSFSGPDKTWGRQLKKAQTQILRLLDKELKLVTKNHYRNTWLAIGMAVFGIPLGTAFGAALGNMGLLGLGLPIGMAIGMAVGATMDKKAHENGKQLDLEINY